MLTIGSWIVLALIGLVLISLGLRLTRRLAPTRFGGLWGAVALPTLALGLYLGLLWAPADIEMGNVQRLMYVHFPSWVGTGAAFLTAFLASLLYLFRRKDAFDHWALAGVEVGLVFNAIGIITGALWGRPTWGVYWTWDPRLTTTAIMFITFAAYLSLRSFIDEPERRARFSAVVAIIAFINLPIVYFSVRWWRTLHQPQSSPETVDPQLVLPLRIMMLAFLLLCGWMITQRYEIARLRAEEDRRVLELELAR